MEENKWIDVILNVTNLYEYQSLQKRTSRSDKKRKRVKDYLKKLEKYSKLCLRNRGTRFERLYKNIFYYKKYIIREIPQSYFDSLIKKGLITEEEAIIKTKELIQDQKKSLEEWINYFIYGNGRFYPMYEQFWAFQGLQKLGAYDKKTKKFKRKRKNTINPIPQLDEAALEMTMALMEKYIEKGEVIEDIKEAYSSYNFKLLYEYSLEEIEKKRKIKTTDGIWKKYEQKDHDILLDDLKGKYTGWCIERKSWVKKYLNETDIYVYYTKDIYGKYKEPRLVIRAQGKDLKEVKGISPNQNVEFELTDILHEKLEEFSFSEYFFEREKNIKLLSIIEKKTESDIPLSNDEIRFLYEIDNIILTFGGERDYRIKEIIKRRNIKEDLSKVFNIDKEKIAQTFEELNENTLLFYGDLEYYKDDELTVICNDEEYIAKDIYIPKYILGNMTLKVPKEDLKIPKLITESFDLFCEEEMDELILPKFGINLSVYGLKRANKITVPDTRAYSIRFFDLEKCGIISLPEISNSDIDFRNLTNVDYMRLPKIVKGSVNLSKIKSIQNIIMPEIIERGITIPKMTDIERSVIK